MTSSLRITDGKPEIAPISDICAAPWRGECLSDQEIAEEHDHKLRPWQ